MRDLVKKFKIPESDRIAALREVGFFFESASVDLSEKDRLLIEVMPFVDMNSKEELISIIWAVGKHSSGISRKALLDLICHVNDGDVAWQYMVSYENIVGNVILKEFVPAFNRLRLYAEVDARIKEAVARFSEQ